MTNITLIPITHDYLPEREGVYLIKAMPTGNHPLRKPRFLEARVTIGWDSKNRRTYAIDISNQVATEISTQPIR